MALSSFFGNAAFTQIGKEQFHPDGWDLDRMAVQFRGPYSGLDAFLNSLTLWSASSINADMFLADYSVDAHRQYPTVSAVYLGKRNGSSTPVRTNTDRAEQSAGFSEQTSAGSGDITLSYKTGRNTATQISRTRSMPTVSDPNVVVFGDVTLVKLKWTGGYRFFGNIMDYFIQQVITDEDSIELVPGQYYRNTITKTRALLGAA